jgi:oligopeptidase A
VAKTGREVDRVLPWDRPYWSAKMQSELYSFDSETLRPYFPVDAVLNGLFSIAQTIYGITIREKPTYCGGDPVEGAVEVYHPDVRFFEIFDSESGRYIGSFVADLYARETKQDGAWADSIDVRGLAFMACDLQRGGFLDHWEVETEFHEFGHVCHILLCEVPYCVFESYATPWDFLELPSQLLENFTWERESLRLFSAIPDDLFARFLQTRLFQRGIWLMRQLSFGKIDLELHLNYEKYAGRNIDEVDREILKGWRPQHSVQTHSVARMFSHIFGEQTYHAAGYYSYEWAQVLDADVFARFKEDGIVSSKVGKRFRHEVLAKGASVDTDVLFREFMGRDPDLTAFLAREGIHD